MSLRLSFAELSVSRRSLMSGLAAATASFALPSTAAWAQAPAWKEYRNIEMGFRVEMPGTPKGRGAEWRSWRPLHPIGRSAG